MRNVPGAIHHRFPLTSKRLTVTKEYEWYRHPRGRAYAYKNPAPMLAFTRNFGHAGLGAEAFLLRGREPALGSRWPFAGMTGPKFGRVNEMKKVTPRRSRRPRWSLFETDSMELVGVPGTDSRESMNSADDEER
ncbi:hypothetical protein ARMSODRAFT_187491 [Armillaria solidipes]|uniref:Uncharacterized protein n=1 Tax=Armillaria solidipes TaxID=1076256 RepID=A0A2H3BRN5_9AGAR|nr:hypothetical protein ARMSODRAFT_187491 [Armillaria solidipes]